MVLAGCNAAMSFGILRVVEHVGPPAAAGPPAIGFVGLSPTGFESR
jgi:hypothetical protein